MNVGNLFSNSIKIGIALIGPFAMPFLVNQLFTIPKVTQNCSGRKITRTNMKCLPHWKWYMKITTLCCMVWGLSLPLLNANPLEAQVLQQRMSLQYGSSNVYSIIKDLERRSSIDFGFTEVLKLKSKRTGPMNFENIALGEFLKILLTPYRIDYKEISNAIILSKVQTTGILTGRVSTVEGTPITGATVRIKGTEIVTVTDETGTYKIDLKPGTYSLEISFISYKTAEEIGIGIEEGLEKTVDVILEESEGLLNEVVVIGYGSQKRENLTGAVASIQTNEITQNGVANVSNMLAGRLPGLVTLQSNGRPGADQATLNIRGFGAPLVLVDGVEGDINMLDPNEIASISVLKDASAAVYGARAGNGVIMVTTKRGNAQSPTISFKSNITIQGSTNMPKMSSSGQFAEVQREGHIQGGQPAETAPYTEVEIEKFYNGTDPQYPNTNWFDLLMRDWAPQQQHTLSVLGGSEKIKYYGMVGYLHQETIMKRSDASFSRYNLRSNLDAQIAKGLKARFDFSTIVGISKYPFRGMTSNFFGDLWNTSPVYAAEFPDKSKTSFAGGGGTGGAHITSDRKLTGYNDRRDQDLKAVLDLNYQFDGVLKGLEARSLVDYHQGFGAGKIFQIPVSFYNYDYGANVYTLAGNFGASSNLNLSRATDRQVTTQTYLTYKKFIADHDIQAMGVYETIDYYNDNLMAARSNFLTSAIDEMLAGSTDGMTNSGSTFEMGRSSIIGRLNYSYRNKYILEASLRADASAKFPKDSRWGYFPSILVAWKLSDENFLRNMKNLDLAKLRLSYGSSGNDGIGNFQYLAGYAITDQTSGGSYIIGSSKTPGIIQRGLANPDLTWEQLSTYNVGLDLSLYKELLYVNMDLFYRKRNGIPGIRSISLPSSVGAVMPTENLNSDDTRGFDLAVGTSKTWNNFSWKIQANISWSRSKWVYFDEPNYADPDQERINKKTGNWTNRTFGYIADGLFSSQDEIKNLPYDQDLRENETLRPGDVKYLDLNNDGLINWKDQKVIGYNNFPMWMSGINANIRYKKFDLSFLLQGGFGYNIHANTRQAGMISTFFYDNRWTEENNNRNALVPRVGGAGSNGWTSNYNQIDASYLRLKNLYFGYSFDGDFLRTAYLKNVRVFVSGSNLFTWSKLNKYSIDPEAPSGGGGLYYPQQRTLSAGIEISL